MRTLAFIVFLGLGLAACAPAAVEAPASAGDVRIEGVSILGAWDAIGSPDQPQVDRDLRSGMLTRLLVFNPHGRVTLSGTDRRAGTGHISYPGTIRGDRLTFDELPGTATVRLRNQQTLEVIDPAGNRTVYRRRR
jgi:hypothetical protein